MLPHLSRCIVFHVEHPIVLPSVSVFLYDGAVGDMNNATLIENKISCFST